MNLYALASRRVTAPGIPSSASLRPTLLLTVLLTLPLAGCGHRRVSPVASAPPLPPITYPNRTYPDRTYPDRAHPDRARPPVPAAPLPPSSVSTDDAQFIATHKPIYVEQGVASWYGPPYHNRVGANGQVFDQNVMSAAHRTLPMGSLIVVTNEKTGQSATMRVTDRGPFVQGRLLDLSMASAKATGIYRAGLATVRVEVFQTPRPMEAGGRWCVQVGAFEHEKKAEKLRDELEKEYESANVINFTGPTGYWVRIRPKGDNREQAELIQRELQPTEGDAYLVRLD